MILFRLHQPCFSLSDLGFCAEQGCFEGNGIDLEETIAFFDGTAFGKGAFLDDPCHLRPDFNRA